MTNWMTTCKDVNESENVRKMLLPTLLLNLFPIPVADLRHGEIFFPISTDPDGIYRDPRTSKINKISIFLIKNMILVTCYFFL
jgi:hypothetical protein